MQHLCFVSESRPALRQHWLGIENEVYEIDQAQSIIQARQWAEKHPNGLMLIDIALVDFSGTYWQQLLAHPTVHSLVGSLSPSDPEGQEMLVAGAKAYFHAYSPTSISTPCYSRCAAIFG